jgi:putative ABC transport system permease protein
MGKPNVALINEATMLTPFEGLGLSSLYLRPVFVGVIAVIGALSVAWFLRTEYGLALRATGANKRMARAQGIETAQKTYVGMGLSNALVALAGALFAQTNGFADSTMGIGTIVVGLAAVIIGETLLPTRAILVAVLACIVGSVIYRIAVALALNVDFLGFNASDLNLITALLVAFALILPRLRARVSARAGKARRS